MICRGGDLADERVSTGNIDNSCQTTYQNPLTGMLEPIFEEMEMSEAVLTEIDKSRLSDDPNPVV